MKKTIYTLALGALLLTGCTQEETPAYQGEEVTMTVTAKLPQEATSRADGETTLLANKYVVGIYEVTGENKYTIAKQEDAKTISSNSFECEVTLIKGKAYRLVFWAYNQGDDETGAPYVLSDLEKVSINAKAENLEAFTASIEATGGVAEQTEITLTRPVAVVRIGTIEDDYTSAKGLGYTPGRATMTLSGCPESYNAVTGEANTGEANENEGESSNLIFTKSIDEKVKFTVESEEYISFAEAYTFAFDKGSSITCKLEVMATDETSAFFSDTYGTEESGEKKITVKPNHRTNIIGRLMTGTTTYSVSISSEPYTEDNDIEIQ